MKKDLNEMLSRCVRCGRCRSVCPTYPVIQREWGVARGRVALVQALNERKLEPSHRLGEHIATCLLCRACEEICTNETPVASIIEMARARLADEIGLPLYKRIASRLLRDPSLMEKLVRIGAISKPLWGREATFYRGIALKIPLLRRQLIPSLPKGSSAFRGKSYGEGKRGTLVLFMGCLLEFLYPQVLGEVLKVLTAFGYKVVVPPQQSCCGHPHLAIGDRDTAQLLMEKNMEALEECEADGVVTACATCTSHLKAWYKLKMPVLDFAEVILAQDPTIYETPPSFGKRVTYHEPCHLSRGQGLKGVSQLLKALFTTSYVEMEDYQRCCGFGGVMAVEYPEISSGVGKEKVKRIEESGAQLVATDCPACMLQMNNLLFLSEVNARAIHLAELICLLIKG